MRTAIDSNIISAIWSNEPSAPLLVTKLASARAAGALLISPPVFAEIHAHPRVDAGGLKSFLDSTGIMVDFRLTDDVWREAGMRFARYASRRRQAIGAEPRGLLADYIVGAHALLQADCLMTLDPRVFRRDFPELRLI